MPIDDVNYLYEHSVNDSFMFFVDSGTRDRTFFPEPSEYVVTFEEPLKLVYGLDILDAAMPNTMYNIDEDNRTLTFMLMKSSRKDDNDPNWLRTLGDIMYCIIAEQQENLKFRERFNSHVDMDVYVINQAEWDAHPEFVRYMENPLSPDSPPFEQEPYSFFIILSRFVDVSMARLSNNSSVTSLQVYFVSMGETYVVDGTEPLAALITSLQGQDVAYFVRKTPETGWCVTVSRNVAVPESHGSAGVVLSNIAIDTDPVLSFHFQKRTVTLEVGTYNINSLQDDLQIELSSYDIYVSGTDRAESNDLTKQGRIMFSQRDWPFVLNMDASDMYENLGFEMYTRPGSQEYVHVQFNDNKRLYGSKFDEQMVRYKLKAPGNVNLLGMRYIRLRCKEIEDHLSSSATFSSLSTGIGVFKLQDMRDVTNLRFDYLTFLRKPFHPIGKLSRLSLRFETPRGDKYDFKGFNHNILISIKYFAPSMTRAFKQSSLNPNYDPDYIRYVSNLAQFSQIDEEEEAESTDDEDDYEEEDSDS